MRVSRDPVTDAIPMRVRVLILGGGIHGVGILHDLASRGWNDIFLVERGLLGDGTSSKSTKLIHGGLRYLEQVSQFSLVAECLRERRILLDVAPDIVHPINIILPIAKNSKWSWLKIKAGLTAYDWLAGRHNIDRHRRIDQTTAEKLMPPLATENFAHFFSFWDAQTDDLTLVQRVASAARTLGAQFSEGCRVIKATPAPDGWRVEVVGPDGSHQTISALYVINCLGPWAHQFLNHSRLTPMYEAVNNKGVHLLMPDIGMQAGVFVESPTDGRICFILPWQGYTLVGTTEENHPDNPDDLPVREDEIDYLLTRVNPYLRQPFRKSDILATFAGLRWLVNESTSGNISRLSRDSIISEHYGSRGLLMTLYGGKLTSYRALSARIGDSITNHFGEFRPSQTANKQSWNPTSALPLSDSLTRFLKEKD